MNNFLSRIYLNVIAYSLGLAIFYASTVVSIFYGAMDGFSELAVYLSHGVLVTVAVVLASGFVTTGIVFAKRASRFNGWVSALNVNAAALLVSFFIVAAAGLPSGLQFYLADAPAVFDDLAHLSGAIEASITLTSILTGLMSAALSMIAAFAARDGDVEDEEVAAKPAARK